MVEENHYKIGDLVKKIRHGESMAGLIINDINTGRVSVMWETGTATIEIEDDLELIADAGTRGRYLIEGKPL